MVSPNDPDLRQVIADAINELSQRFDNRVEQLAAPVTPEQLAIACQRTLRSVETSNSKLTGGDLSACLVVVSHREGVYPWFFLTCRRTGEDHWRPVASVGGVRARSGERFLGKLGGPGSYVAIGSLYELPDGGGIRIELPDGSVREDRATDGCCIALVPLTFSQAAGQPISIRYLNPDGSPRGSEHFHL